MHAACAGGEIDTMQESRHWRHRLAGRELAHACHMLPKPPLGGESKVTEAARRGKTLVEVLGTAHLLQSAPARGRPARGWGGGVASPDANSCPICACSKKGDGGRELGLGSCGKKCSVPGSISCIQLRAGCQERRYKTRHALLGRKVQSCVTRG